MIGHGAGSFPPLCRIPGAEFIRFLCDRNVFFDRVTCNSIFAIVVDKPDGWKISHQKRALTFDVFASFWRMYFNHLSNSKWSIQTHGWLRSGLSRRILWPSCIACWFVGKNILRECENSLPIYSGTLTSTQNGSKNGGWVRGMPLIPSILALRGWNIWTSPSIVTKAFFYNTADPCNSVRSRTTTSCPLSWNGSWSREIMSVLTYRCFFVPAPSKGAN